MSKIKTEIAICVSYGGFDLSRETLDIYSKLRGEAVPVSLIERHDPLLIQALKESKTPDGMFCKIKIETIDSPRYLIHEYDGKETVIVPEKLHWNIIDKPEFRNKYPEYFL